MTQQLTDESKKILLTIARDTINAELSGQRLTIPEDYTNKPELQKTGGVFVTLHINKELRGCIGLIESSLPLVESVHEMAYQAAFRDPRFPALTTEELPDVDLEISVLTKPSEVEDPQQIRLGEDGIVFTYLAYRSLFLPQVATDQGWDLETTLNFLARKAGLPPETWQNPESTFQVFQAQHFNESELAEQLI